MRETPENRGRTASVPLEKPVGGSTAEVAADGRQPQGGLRQIKVQGALDVIMH